MKLHINLTMMQMKVKTQPILMPNFFKMAPATIYALTFLVLINLFLDRGKKIARSLITKFKKLKPSNYHSKCWTIIWIYGRWSQLRNVTSNRLFLKSNSLRRDWSLPKDLWLIWCSRIATWMIMSLIMMNLKNVWILFKDQELNEECIFIWTCCSVLVIVRVIMASITKVDFILLKVILMSITSEVMPIDSEVMPIASECIRKRWASLPKLCKLYWF